MWLRSEGLDAARADPALRPGSAQPPPRRRRRPGRGRPGRGVRAVAAARPGDAGRDRREAAPGAAGADPDAWLGEVGKVEGAGPVPELWRIGSARIGRRPRRGLPGRRPAARRVAPAGRLHPRQPGTGRSAGRGPAHAGPQLLPARPGPGPRLGRQPVHRRPARLYPLTRTGLLAVHDPGRLPQLLDELSDRIRRVHTRVLVDGHPSLRALAATTGARTEPWLVAVLVGNRSACAEEEHRQLQRVARGGLACGVQLVLLDVPMTVNAPVETVRIADDGTATTSMTGPYATVTLDPALPREDLTRACHAIADEHERWRGRIGAFADLLPGARPLGPGGVAQRPARPDRVRRRDAGRDRVGRRVAARARRRPQRLGQDQPAAHDDQLARRPVRPGRAGALPARLQGGRVLRAVRARAAGTPPGSRTPGSSA